MFRGGRVSAYGTGIASGLADGGMPNKRGLVTGPGGYAGYRDRQVITGGDLLKKTQSASPYKFGETGLAQTGIGTLNWLKTLGAAGYDLAGVPLNKLTQFATGYNPGFSGADFFGIEPDKTDTAYWMGIPTSTKEGWTIPSMEEEEVEETITPQQTERKALQAMTADEAYKLAEKKPGKQIELDVDNKGESDYEESLALEADEYFNLLGGEKAKGKDITAMLLGFAGAEGDTTMEKFQKFAAEEAKRPGKADALKEAAAMMAIKDKIATKRSNEQLQKLMSVELFRDKLASARGTGDIIDQYNLAMKGGETNKTTGLSIAVQKIKGKAPTIVQEKLPPVTVADVGEVFIVEKEDPKTKVKTRIAVEIILDENEQVSFRTLMKI
tara:strand:- start:2542 stop:3690 length:1149 start_codon:yes stop_codon:yes gene_type:complete